MSHLASLSILAMVATRWVSMRLGSHTPPPCLLLFYDGIFKSLLEVLISRLNRKHGLASCHSLVLSTALGFLSVSLPVSWWSSWNWSPPPPPPASLPFSSFPPKTHSAVVFIIPYPLAKLGWLPLLYFKLLTWGTFHHSCLLFIIPSLHLTSQHSVVSLLTLPGHHCLDRLKREISLPWRWREGWEAGKGVPF